MNEKRPVFTIGHGASDFFGLLSVLERHGVTTLVDVRSVPYSRHAPDFVKATLEEHCRAAGLGYRWMGDRLGGRPGSGDREAVAPAGFAGALGEIGHLSSGGNVALLCSEADPAHCHRSSVLAPALEAAGHHIVHLLHDGSAVPHQPGLFEPGEA